MDTFIMLAQFFLSLSILIVLHEMGHFFPAKWFKTKVEKFYLFFNPGFSLFKKQIGETEYGLGWLPLGGYVKIAGMIDESMDKEQMQGPPQPWEFRSKPAWQRLIIMLGGVIVNFILGFLIFGMILFVWGKVYLPAKNIEHGYIMSESAQNIGFQDGDMILKVGDVALDSYDPAMFRTQIILEGARTVDVERNGRNVQVEIPESYAQYLSSHDSKGDEIFSPRLATIIAEVAENMPAEKAGLKKGDRLMGINGETLAFYHELVPQLLVHANERVQLDFLRDGQSRSVDITPTSEGKLGFMPQGIQTERREYSIAQAIPAGVKEGYTFLANQIKAFGKMFSGKIKAKDSLGGFGTISNLFPKVWDWERFWYITAVLSLILGFMNLLPIPALDGGHVMFLLFEMITGRKPSDKFMEYATIVGFVIVIALVLFANGLDLMRWINK